jgi:menaquinone-dependent protoporphyrinogen oxidase
MRVLVTAASKHGSTLEIAAAIAERLREQGLDVHDPSPEEAGDVGGYDGVVLGSAVYAGHWMKPALDLAEREAEALRERAVWLFSSGPIGEPEPKPEGDPVDVEGLIESTAARGHWVFAGKLDRDRLSFPERAIVRALRAQYGDFRDWRAIEAFADEVAAVLGPQAPGA